MFKIFGFFVGVGLMLLAAVAWFDAPQAKKVSSQLHDQLNETIDHITQQELTSTPLLATALPLPEVVQALVDEVSPPAIVENFQELAIEATEVDQPWHIFWAPFKSQASAEGFALRLSKLTGVNISTITDETGHYRVNFSYFDETDKLRIIQLIKEKTGLEVDA